MFSALKAKAAALVTAGILLALVAVLGFAGYQYVRASKLEANVAVLTTQVSGLTADLQKANKTNADNQKELERLRQGTTITDQVTGDHAKNEQAGKVQYDALQKKVAERLKAIEAEYAAKEKTEENAKRKAVAISLERSRGIWLMYCNAVPAAVECKE